MQSDLSAPAGSDQSSSRDHDLILSFNNTPIRYVVIDGLPWFALPDICEAANYHPRAYATVRRRDFPAHAVQTFLEVGEDGQPQEVVMLSPVGVYWLTALFDPGRGQAISAWARREALSMCPEPAKDNAAMWLKLSPTGELPPRPMRYSGRKVEWEDLRFSPEYMNFPRVTRQEVQRQLLERAALAREAANA